MIIVNKVLSAADMSERTHTHTHAHTHTPLVLLMFSRSLVLLYPPVKDLCYSDGIPVPSSASGSEQEGGAGKAERGLHSCGDPLTRAEGV